MKIKEIEMLPEGAAAVRHLVVVSDGEVHDPLDSQMAAIEARRRGVTVSVIQIVPIGLLQEGLVLFVNWLVSALELVCLQQDLVNIDECFKPSNRIIDID